MWTMSHHYLLTQNSQSQRRVCIKKEDRQKRVDERRVAEAAEQEKENQRDLANLSDREDSEEELTVHIDHTIQTESCPW